MLEYPRRNPNRKAGVPPGKQDTRRGAIEQLVVAAQPVTVLAQERKSNPTADVHDDNFYQCYFETGPVSRSVFDLVRSTNFARLAITESRCDG